ncbi:hypothetical protein CY34DRAFT_98238 [Suillus luteus UH-Slu-Lm8-n1]|uniref:Uncharacterized protein n=1 Tax=Suillus luteus UH-Slu-Lm8-n1 TaxID=930992 RepID=A0A0D0AQP2_9AGAM|nr:hypothetical protein CY34DRAFT_98238 [Suillus luteus UH-Slu-Lm8-n1]
MAVPAEGVPTDEEDRESCEWWKAKKWAYGILGRLFHRCVSSSHILRIFQFLAEWFASTFGPSDCTDTFSHSIKPKSTWILLKPHVDSLVANFAFPQLAFDASKQAMCEADPVEYVRGSVGKFTWSLSCQPCQYKYENLSSPVSGATSFLLSLASNCTKTAFLPMLQFINTVVRSCVLVISTASINFTALLVSLVF